MSTGTVKFFNAAKGFGFIKEDGSEKDYFIHVSEVIGEITDGDQVEFTIDEGKKGPEAKQAKKID